MKSFGKKRNSNTKVSFNLENNHFRNLHLMLYFASLVVVLVVYTFILLILGKSSFSYMVMVVFSVLVGVFLVFKKDEIVKIMSNEMDKRKRIEIKKKDNINLKKTLLEVGSRPKRKVGERNKNLKLNIVGKVPLKDKISKITSKLSKKNSEVEKKGPEYIEIED